MYVIVGKVYIDTFKEIKVGLILVFKGGLYEKIFYIT